MEWTNDLSVGVSKIDYQHKELIRRVNAFLDSGKSNAGNTEVLNMLSFLEMYVRTHFRDEEELQLKSGYPHYAEHKKMHDKFIETVQGIKQDIQKNGFTPVTRSLVGSTMINWLVTHISSADKKLGAHILSQANQAV
jgi:hemerythrin